MGAENRHSRRCPGKRESQTGLASESLCSSLVNTHFPCKQKMLYCSFDYNSHLWPSKAFRRYIQVQKKACASSWRFIRVHVNATEPPVGQPCWAALHRAAQHRLTPAPSDSLRAPGHRFFRLVFSQSHDTHFLKEWGRPVQLSQLFSSSNDVFSRLPGK